MLGANHSRVLVALELGDPAQHAFHPDFRRGSPSSFQWSGDELRPASASSIPAVSRSSCSSTALQGQKAGEPVPSQHCPQSTPNPSARARSDAARESRVLPIPAPPVRKMGWVFARKARSRARSMEASSARRPTMSGDDVPISKFVVESSLGSALGAARLGDGTNR
jgi:hypothetical protein